MKPIIVRIGLTAIGLVVLITLAGGGLMVAMFRHFNPAPPKAAFEKATDALDAQRQDVIYFGQLIALDRAFTPSARLESSRRIAALEQLLAPLDHPHFRVALMQIDALADNGHSKVGYEAQARPAELPVRVATFADGLYVMRTTESNEDLLGGRIVAIDGKPIDTVLTLLESLRGGTPQWKKSYAAQYLHMQDMLYGLDIATDMQHSIWTVVAPTGETVTRTLESYVPPPDEPQVFIKRWYSSEPLKEMTKGWRAFEPNHSLPLTLVDFDNNFRRQRLMNSCTMLVQFKSNEDEGAQHIKDFISATETDMRKAKPCHLILDLRYDDGGNYMNTFDFASKVPNLIAPGGRIYLLTGPSTFSAGISTATFVKQAGADRVTILGEAVGDRLQFYSEGGRGCLPNYPLCVSYETGKHDYQYPCTDWDICFWPNYYFRSRVKSIDPDEIIPVSFKDWRAGVDPVFERAETLANSDQHL